MNVRYFLRPKAGDDLDDQSLYLARKGSPEIGHRFLIAAHETFILLATHPEAGWHPRLKNAELAALRTFRITGFERMLVLYKPRADGVEILRVIHGSRNLDKLLQNEGLE